MERQKKTDSGITLVALVVSIIVMLVLAGVSLNATVGDNGIISKARLATIMNKFAGYKEQLELNAVEDEGVYASGQTIKNYIPDMEDLDIEKFVIMKRQLMYLENDELEIEACKNVGIQTADTGEEGSASAISEVKSVISGVVDLASNEGDAFRVPEDDFDVTTDTNDTSEGLIGIRLYDRNSANIMNKTWNILIEYSKDNQEVNRYGSGYYWLKKGETYTINGESKTFENDFIVDYANKQYTVLSGRAVNWNVDSTIAVSEGLALNVDPMSLADGEWKASGDGNYQDFYIKDARTGNSKKTNTQKIGDVSYEPSIKGLKLNQTETNGYLRLKDDEITCENGFTFELYAKITSVDGGTTGFFTRRPETGWNYKKAMRFFYRFNLSSYSGISGLAPIARFGPSSNLTSQETRSPKGAMMVRGSEDSDPGYTWIKHSESGIRENQTFYLTAVYRTKNNALADDFMKTKNADKLEWYINGNLIDFCYWPHSGYEAGREVWDKPGTYFYIGQSMVSTDLFYLKGELYTTRLYTQPMTATQVKDNYDTTLKYRSSF